MTRSRLAQGIARGAGGGGGNGASTQGFDDFESYTAGGGLPSTWTQNWGPASWDIEANAGVGGTGKALKAVLSINEQNVATFDEIGSVDDVELVLRVLSVDTDGTGNIEAFNPATRVGGSAGSEDAYRYRITTDAGNNFVNIAKYVGGNFSSKSSVSFALSADSWYLLRAQAIGTDLRLRAWLNSDTEPTGWDIERTDSDLTAGNAGVLHFNAGTWFCDYFSYTTDPQNESAPLP